MSFKNFKKLMATFLVATFIMPLNIFAYSKFIIAGGENIGIQIQNNGVIVAGFYDVNGSNNASESSLKTGDIIVKAGDTKISSIDDFVGAIKVSNQKSLNLVYERNSKEKTTTLNLVDDNGTIKTGLYVKDTISGLGTLTYIDPESKIYGALGHQVIESTTGVMINVKEGKIYNSKVTSIDKSIRGEPGAKSAITNTSIVYGNIKENTSSGIFGTYNQALNQDKLYEVADYSDIKVGKAQIITVLKGEEKKTYNINIISINNDKNDNKNILFNVTDQTLINKTGGIIQGMSGSPIIQDNKIIGAVTNVVVNDPTRGYGILITSMLEEGEN